LQFEFLTAVLLNIILFSVVGLCRLLNRNGRFAQGGAFFVAGRTSIRKAGPSKLVTIYQWKQYTIKKRL
jgi:hypothetical protein